MDGSNGSSTFTDSSKLNKNVTRYGNASISTSLSKFGGASGSFDGSGDYLTVPSSSDFNWSVGDVVIEFWIRTTNMSVSRHICGTTSSNSDGKTSILVQSDGSIVVSLVGVNSVASSSGVILLNTWHYVACVKYGSYCYIYVDGARQASGLASAAWSSGSAQFTIGRTYQTGGTDGDWFGNIDDLRVTINSNRSYTGSTISIPTSAYPDSSVLLQGVQGVQGTQGTQGVQGTQGIQGIQGIRGSASTYSVLIGDGTNTTYTVTHNLSTSNDTYVVVRDTTTNYYVYPDVLYVNSNSIQVIFVSAPTTNQYRVSVIGT